MEDVQVLKIPEDTPNETILVKFLYRPGHYDILYAWLTLDIDSWLTSLFKYILLALFAVTFYFLSKNKLEKLPLRRTLTDSMMVFPSFTTSSINVLWSNRYLSHDSFAYVFCCHISDKSSFKALYYSYRIYFSLFFYVFTSVNLSI